MYLERFDLFGHADGSAVTPVETASEATKSAFNSSAKKAWTSIYLAVESGQQIHVRDTETAKQALKSQFARESILQKVRLRHEIRVDSRVGKYVGTY